MCTESRVKRPNSLSKPHRQKIKTKQNKTHTGRAERILDPRVYGQKSEREGDGRKQ